jgi:hypothetical protein
MAARAACDEHAACWSPRAGLSMRTATRTAATTHRTKEVPGPLLTEEHGKASAASSFLQANTNGVPVRGSVNCISVTQTLCQTRPEKPDCRRAASAARRLVETLISPVPLSISDPTGTEHRLKTRPGRTGDGAAARAGNAVNARHMHAQSHTPVPLTLQSLSPPRLVHPRNKAVPRDTTRRT